MAPIRSRAAACRSERGAPARSLALGIALGHLVGGVFTDGGLRGPAGLGPGPSTGSDTSRGPRRSARQVIEARLRAMILIERVALRSASRHSRTARSSPARHVPGCGLTGGAERFDRVASEAGVVRGDAGREAEEPEARRGLFIVGKCPCEAFSRARDSRGPARHGVHVVDWDGAGRSITRSSRRLAGDGPNCVMERRSAPNLHAWPHTQESPLRSQRATVGLSTT